MDFPILEISYELYHVWPFAPIFFNLAFSRLIQDTASINTSFLFKAWFLTKEDRQFNGASVLCFTKWHGRSSSFYKIKSTEIMNLSVKYKHIKQQNLQIQSFAVQKNLLKEWKCRGREWGRMIEGMNLIKMHGKYICKCHNEIPLCN
jgi:hypothetical protein